MLRLVESKRMLHHHILPSPPVFLDSNMQIHLSGPVQGGMGLLGPRAESFNHIRAQEKLRRMTHYKKKDIFKIGMKLYKHDITVRLLQVGRNRKTLNI